ncbi:hypothetical protein [Phenylobacterium immobile]|uniref:hypothetical protein n=1 Tax=Phenylobacterium immobile TaxID=21 RepID=UPI000B845B08|nr:hypothetical protein [Phenylobacterium immobile]
MSKTRGQGNLRAALAAVTLSATPAWAQRTPVLWAWERPEDLWFAPGVEVTVQTGFVEVGGAAVTGRGRMFVLHAAPGQVSTALVHIQIDHGQHRQWTAALRARTAAKGLAFARAGSPYGTALSMTGLASWCGSETWLALAPVDDIVPMLFRVGPGGRALAAAITTRAKGHSRSCTPAIRSRNGRRRPHASTTERA